MTAATPGDSVHVIVLRACEGGVIMIFLNGRPDARFHGTVIGGENDNGVIGLAGICECFEELANGVVTHSCSQYEPTA